MNNQTNLSDSSTNTIITATTTNNNNENLLKQCRVCGDKALGFNFNGLSCESCKAFFRRNAVKQKEWKCRKGDGCLINIVNRKKCKKCRLKRCFDIGMKKELIWCCRDGRQQPSKNSEYTQIHKLDSNMSETAQSPELSLSHLSTDLTLYELELIDEVACALAVFPDEASLKIVANSKSLVQTFNLPANYIKRIILFCKQMSAFRCLKQSDQLLIIKEFFCEICAVRFSYYFNWEKDGFPIIETEAALGVVFVQMDIFAEFTQQHDLAEFYRRFFSTMNVEMENDIIIRNLIIAQLLFNKRESLSCPEYIRYNYVVYCQLIRRYLEHKYKSFDLACRKYASLMNALAQVECIITTVRDVYLSFDTGLLVKALQKIYNTL